MYGAVRSILKGIVLGIVTVAITPILALSELADAFNSLI
jgi:hypothetical protein